MEAIIVIIISLLEGNSQIKSYVLKSSEEKKSLLYALNYLDLPLI